MSLPRQCLLVPHKLAGAIVVAFVGTAVGINAQNVCYI
jgi:flagellar motor component MotA